MPTDEKTCKTESAVILFHSLVGYNKSLVFLDWSSKGVTPVFVLALSATVVVVAYIYSLSTKRLLLLITIYYLITNRLIINSSLWTCSHLMAIRSQNKNTGFLMILALLCRFNVPKYSSIIISLNFHISMQLISETGLFHNFYKLSFTGIDKNTEMICILCRPT